MRIRLAILEKDTMYLQKMVAVFNNKYGNELEIYSFTELDAAMDCISSKKIDVFLANSAFDINFVQVPEKIGFAYLVESLDIDRFNEKRAICKFQKIDLIYKQILNIYSEQIPNIIGSNNDVHSTVKTIAFSSPCGGVGTSTVAAGCAISLASKGYRTLYLNLETYGNSDAYFSCDGQFDFSEVIYAIKSNKTNRAIKLQSTVKQDSSGVYYYSSVKVPLDMMELNSDDFSTLQREIQMLDSFDYIVVDIGFPADRKSFEIFQNCNSIVMVADSAQESGAKIEKALRAIQIIDNQSEYAVQPKMFLIKNKCVSGNDIAGGEVKVIGSIPMFESVSPMQLARQFALSNIYDGLL